MSVAKTVTILMFPANKLSQLKLFGKMSTVTEEQSSTGILFKTIVESKTAFPLASRLRMISSVTQSSEGG
ncbi:MAG: hypothetical protein R2784_01475 [Saprospiraceae bacterium]